MGKSVDERVVEMQFDNKQFESGIRTSLKSLANLKNSLNMDSATKSLSKLEKASNSFSMSGMERAVHTIADRFTNLGVVGTTVLVRIADSAITQGARIVKGLSLEPVLTGFEEYETKMNAITTILTNTQSKGTTLDDVNKALNELNKYADQTIYNFAEMTKNIGTFTAAGVDLNTSVNAIKGIANLAAGSGSTPAQAANAMYQLSQALAAGRVSLQDWNSVVNAGMGGELFQNALKETAKQMGIVVDESISFRESISSVGGKSSWLTSDVLIKTLEKFANDPSLVKAATQVKTFTQLIDTMKESVQSGWAQSWEYIIGDREQAAELFTSISEGFNSIIGPSTDARNAMLQFWNVNGGRDKIIQGLSNVIKTLGSVLSPIGEAFNEAFPPMTGERLVELSNSFLELTKNFKISERTIGNIKSTFKGLFSVVQLGGKVIGALIKPFFNLTGSVGSLGATFFEVTGSIGEFLTKLNESKSVNEALSTVSDSLSKALGGIDNFMSSIFDNTGVVFDFLKDFSSGAVDVLGKAAEKLSDVFQWITDNVGAGDILAGLFGGGVFLSAKKAAGLFDTIRNVIEGIFGTGDKLDDAKTTFSDVLSSMHDSLESFSSGLKVTSLVSIAIAIGILTASIDKLSKIKVTSVTKSLMAISVMMVELSLIFRSVTKSLNKFEPKRLIQASIAMMAIAGAIVILSGAVKTLGELDLDDLAKGLVGVGASLAELSAFVKFTDFKKISVRSSLGLVVMAGALTIIADAVKEFSKLSWDELGKGLTGAAAGLGSLAVAIKIINKSKVSARTSVAILVLAESCKILADAMKQFGGMSWGTIERGLTAMGVALGELVAAVSLLGKFGGGGALLGSAGIFVTVQSLGDIAEFLKDIAIMDWKSIEKGLTTMGVALGELSVSLGLLGKVAGFSSIFAGGAILIVVQGLEPISDMMKEVSTLSWTDIQKGLVTMGVALGELLVVLGALGKIAPFGSLLAGGAILISVQALEPIASALEKIGGLKWESIKNGLIGMGLALAEIAIVTGVLGKLAPLGGLLGSGSILIGVQGLGDLADALKKFGTMDWDTIKNGLISMGLALGELALGSVLNTLSLLGSISISKVAEPLGILADSVNKWKNVSVPKELPAQLGQLAKGILSFTLGGFGAGAIADAAPGIGEMADAISKWKSVSVPDGLEKGLKSISNGVKSFTWAFIGGLSINAAAEPLSKLASSVKKWNGVTIPEGLDSGLKRLSTGVKSFSWAFVGGLVLDSVISPLKNMADAVQKWNSITIPENVEPGLKGLARGIQAFSGTDVSGVNFTSITNGLMSLSVASNTLSNIDFYGLSNGLNAFASSTKGLPAQLSGLAESLSNSMGNIANAIKTQGPAIASAFVSVLSNSIATVNKQASRFTTSGRTIALSFVTGLSNTISSKTATTTNAMKNLFTTVINVSVNYIRSSRSKIQNEGSALVQSFIIGITSKKSAAMFAVRSVASSAASGAKGYTGSFVQVGKDMIQGMINGIYAKRSGAINAAVSVAADSLAAAKRALDSNSPSKKFEKLGLDSDEGLIIGFLKKAKEVAKSSSSVTESALYAAKDTLRKLPTILSEDISLSPRITPVIDLTGVNAGNASIGSMFSKTRTIKTTYDTGKLAKTSSMVSAISQTRNGYSVSDAINTLNKRMQDMENKIGGNNDTLKQPIELHTHVDIDGREIAKSSAVYMQEEMTKINDLNKRLGGRR